MLIGSMGAAVLVWAPISIEKKRWAPALVFSEARHVTPHVGGRSGHSNHFYLLLESFVVLLKCYMFVIPCVLMTRYFIQFEWVFLTIWAALVRNDATIPTFSSDIDIIRHKVTYIDIVCTGCVFHT